MPERAKTNTRSIFLPSALMTGIFVIAFLASCGPPQEQQPQGPRRYSLHGRVVSINKEDNRQLTVEHGNIPGFMMAMTMPYTVKDPAVLDTLSPDDEITADVVVNGDDVWLENIVIVKKATPPKDSPAAKSRPTTGAPKKQ